jgi:hypothetical protein
MAEHALDCFDGGSGGDGLGDGGVTKLMGDKTGQSDRADAAQSNTSRRKFRTRRGVPAREGNNRASAARPAQRIINASVRNRAVRVVPTVIEGLRVRFDSKLLLPVRPLYLTIPSSFPRSGPGNAGGLG